jgi:hypothetical protein
LSVYRPASAESRESFTAPTRAPEGYERTEIRGTIVVARRDHVEAVQTALRSGTLYDYAAQQAGSRSLSGRGIAYATPLPNGEHVVVRHNRHGGLLAPLTGDRFLPPTRAPSELATSLRLASHGVPTPEIIAYVVYRAGPLFRRSDVASREVPHSIDLGAVLTGSDATERSIALGAAAMLIALLSACGARHHDLNIKNILLARTQTRTGALQLTAFVLDVDRVEFGRPGDSRITERNLERFMRSARKWRELHGARIESEDLARVAASVRRLVAARSPEDPDRTRS